MEMLDDREYLTPPDNEAVKIHECYFCNKSIYEGEDCYEIDNLIYCENCIDKHFKIMAEKPDIEGDLADLEYHELLGGKNNGR